MRMLTTALLCGCGIEPFETPSAYDQQRFLCDDPGQLEQAASDCLDLPAEKNCTGVISFQGQIQLVPIKVDTTLQRSIVRLGLEDTVLSRVEISGAAPYFHFDTAISSIGTPTPWKDEKTPYELTFDEPDNPDEPPDLKDLFGAVQWYIRAGSDTAMLSSNEDPGSLITVTEVSDDRVELRFAGSIGPVGGGDTLDACAIVFPQGGVE